MHLENMSRFQLGVPREVNRATRYAFWMTAPERRFLAVLRALNCVASLKRSRATGRILVEISDDHDPDEAWHWIRAELEEASQDVELDAIWVDALKWIL